LPAHAEHCPDLPGAHEVMHGKNHSQDDSSHLTMGQECATLVI
jgi:hypothetical protein